MPPRHARGNSEKPLWFILQCRANIWTHISRWKRSLSNQFTACSARQDILPRGSKQARRDKRLCTGESAHQRGVLCDLAGSFITVHPAGQEQAVLPEGGPTWTAPTSGLCWQGSLLWASLMTGRLLFPQALVVSCPVKRGINSCPAILCLFYKAFIFQI